MPINFTDYNYYVATAPISLNRPYWQPVMHTGELVFNTSTNDGWILYDSNEFAPVVWEKNYSTYFHDAKEEPRFPESPELDAFLDSFKIIRGD